MVVTLTRFVKHIAWLVTQFEKCDLTPKAFCINKFHNILLPKSWTYAITFPPVEHLGTFAD